MTTSDAVQFTGQIAALQGAPGETIQTILSQFAEMFETRRISRRRRCRGFAMWRGGSVQTSCWSAILRPRR